MHVTDLPARGAILLAGRLLGTCHKPGIGDEVTDRWEAGYVMNFIQDGQGEDLANAVYGPEKIERLGIMVPGVLQDEEFLSLDQLIAVLDALFSLLNGPRLL